MLTRKRIVNVRATGIEALVNGTIVVAYLGGGGFGCKVSIKGGRRLDEENCVYRRERASMAYLVGTVLLDADQLNVNCDDTAIDNADWKSRVLFVVEFNECCLFFMVLNGNSRHDHLKLRMGVGESNPFIGLLVSFTKTNFPVIMLAVVGIRWIGNHSHEGVKVPMVLFLEAPFFCSLRTHILLKSFIDKICI